MHKSGIFKNRFRVGTGSGFGQQSQKPGRVGSGSGYDRVFDRVLTGFTGFFPVPGRVGSGSRPG